MAQESSNMSIPLKILFLSENFPPETNAAATRVFERACYWVDAGHHVTIITTAPNFPDGKVFSGYKNSWRQVESISGIRVVRVKTFIAPNQGMIRRTLDFLSFMVTGVWFGLFEAKPDVVAATSPQFFTAVGGWILARLRRVPFIFELGDLWPASIVAVGILKPGFILSVIEKLELNLYHRSEAIVSLTHAFKDNLVMRGVESNKIAVIPNGVDLWRYGLHDRDKDLSMKWNLSGYFIVGYIGTHGMAHGLGNVLDAAEELRNNDQIRFLLVGAGAERDKLMLAAKNRGLKNVIFIPSQTKSSMPAVWSLCNIALVHLKKDPLFASVIPSKIFESMAMGLPILLAAPEGEASKILSSEKAGLHIPAEDPKALADAIESLFNDPDGLKELADNSFSAAPRYSREMQAHHMMTVIQLVVQRRGSEAGDHSLDELGDNS